MHLLSTVQIGAKWHKAEETTYSCGCRINSWCTQWVCIIGDVKRQPVLLKKMQEKKPHFCVAFSHIPQQNRLKQRKRVKIPSKSKCDLKIPQPKMQNRPKWHFPKIGMTWTLQHTQRAIVETRRRLCPAPRNRQDAGGVFVFLGPFGLVLMLALYGIPWCPWV